jgi:hypothetical protein
MPGLPALVVRLRCPLLLPALAACPCCLLMLLAFADICGAAVYNCLVVMTTAKALQ